MTSHVERSGRTGTGSDAGGILDNEESAVRLTVTKPRARVAIRPRGARDTGTVDTGDAIGSRSASKSPTWATSLLHRLGAIHPAAWLTAVGAIVFAVVFGRLGMQNQRNFGTWAFDMGIYDQGFWLVSRGQSWITVRGIDFWGHHFNPIVFAFVPFYWLGAGPEFLYVAQAAALGAGAIPVYLLARDRTRNPWVGLVFAVVYLMYAPIQWIAWANFHPEALVVTPFLFAWWFGTRRRWLGCYVSLVVALSTREDVALAVIVMGVVLWWWLRRRDDQTASARTGGSVESGADNTQEVADHRHLEPDAVTRVHRGTSDDRAHGKAPITTTRVDREATSELGLEAAAIDATAGSPSDTTTDSPKVAARTAEPNDETAGSPSDATAGSPSDATIVVAEDVADDQVAADLRARDRRMALLVSVLGFVWYVVATRLIIPAFNRGLEPFYIEYFYGHYGSNTREIVEAIMTRPDRVVSDATQDDRLRFYRDLLLPWGGLPLGGLAELAMAGPQMLASVIGTSPYARTIRYQYTSVMIAPIVIAAIEATAWMWRHRLVRRYLVPWLLVCAYVTNVAWSPSPISANDGVWATASPRHAAMNAAVDLVPDDASVTATYSLLPHLSHREQIYNWPNPWVPSYWSNDDTYRLPDPSSIDYLVVDRLQVGGEQAELVDSLIGPGGDYELVFDRDDVIVARRR